MWVKDRRAAKTKAKRINNMIPHIRTRTRLIVIAVDRNFALISGENYDANFSRRDNIAVKREECSIR